MKYICSYKVKNNKCSSEPCCECEDFDKCDDNEKCKFIEQFKSRFGQDLSGCLLKISKV